MTIIKFEKIFGDLIPTRKEKNVVHNMYN